MPITASSLTLGAKKLVDFLAADPARTQLWFEGISGIPQQDVSKYVRGLARPSDFRRGLIEGATGGAVVATDWLTEEEREKLEKANKNGAVLRPAA